MALLAFLRAYPDDLDEVRRVVASASPESLLTEAKLHGLSALVQHAVRDAKAELSEPWKTQLAQEALGMAGGTLRAKALLHEALDILGQAGLSPILLKGYVLGARLYPEPLLRPTSDVDVFIAEDEVKKASEALTAHGFRPMEEAAESYHREHHHHVTFGTAKGSVELHFRLMTGFDAQLGGFAERHRAIRLSLEGREVKVLSAEDEALYLAAHAARHLFGRISWLYDLKLLLRRTDVDWALIAERARAVGLQGPVYMAFELVRRALDGQVPGSLERRFGVTRWHEALLRLAFSDAQLEGSVWLGRKWPGFALTAALASSPASRARFAAHHVARGLRRRAAKRFPDLVPSGWRG